MRVPVHPEIHTSGDLPAYLPTDDGCPLPGMVAPELFAAVASEQVSTRLLLEGESQPSILGCGRRAAILAWGLLIGPALASSPPVASTVASSLEPQASREQRMPNSLLLIEDMTDAGPRDLLLLNQALRIVEAGKDPDQQVNDLIRIARTYGRLAQRQRSEEVLLRARQQVPLVDRLHG